MSSNRVDRPTGEAGSAPDPSDADSSGAQVDLGADLFLAGRYAEAEAAFRRALELEPANPYAHRNLWFSYYQDGRFDEAAEILRSWKAHHPDDAFPEFMLSALTGADTPDRMPAAVVRNLFDGYSDSYDENLAGIGYRGPAIVAAALAAALGPPARALDILDAGCGTGLCGPQIRPFARRLTGIDLSAAMLEKARLRYGYDALAEGDLTEFLRASPEQFDVVVSADTLLYFGDLSELCAAADTALRPGGRFIFTVEQSDGAPDGYSLGREGRYQHGEAYLRRVLAEARFTEVEIGAERLRFETGRPVAGFVLTARKP